MTLRTQKALALGIGIIAVGVWGMAGCSDAFGNCEDTRTCPGDNSEDAGSDSAGANGGSGGTGGVSAGGSGASAGANGGSAGMGGSGQMCPDGLADCDGDGSCEVDITRAETNCGACGHECAGPSQAAACSQGVCVHSCAAGTADCSTPEPPATDDGCETTLATSVEHCGACGFACDDTGTDSVTCMGGGCVPSCLPDFGDCVTPTAPEADDGCESNFKTSSEHCGRCGHSCLGGECVDGVCQPVALAENETATNAIAIDADAIYFGQLLDSAELRKVAKTGGSVTTLATGGRGFDVEVDDTHVYWAEPLEIRKALKDGSSSAEGLLDAPMGNSFGKIAINDTHLFLTTGLFPGGVSRIDKTAPANLTGIVTTLEFASNLRVDATSVFFSRAATGSGPGQIPIDGGTIIDTAGAPGQLFDIDDTHLYWKAASIVRRPKAGGATQTIVQEALLANPIRQLTVGSTHVYWLTDAGEVMRAPKSPGSMPQTLATGQPNPEDIVVDDIAIYWSNRGEGSDRNNPTPNTGGIMKLAMP